MRILALLGGFLVLLVSGITYAEMYTAQELDADRTRIVSRVADLHGKLTLPQFLLPEARWLAGAPVETPDVAPDGDPMGFMAVRGRVILPVSGLKFMEDLTMAYAWRFRAGRSLEPFDEYLAMLRWKPESDWPQGRYLDPLEAFGVPDRVWERDAALGELGTAFRNEAWAFMLGHELEHIRFRRNILH